MSEEKSHPAPLGYASNGERGEITFERAGDEIRISFPTRAWGETLGLRIGTLVLAVTIGTLVLLIAIHVIVTDIPWEIILPFMCLFAMCGWMFRFISKSPSQYDVLVVLKKGIRIEQHDRDLERDVEMDWDAIRSFEFRSPSLIAHSPKALVFETTGGMFVIELHRPSELIPPVLNALEDSYRRWSNEIGPEALAKIKIEQDRLITEHERRVRLQIGKCDE